MRRNSAGRLIVPLRALDGALHTVEFIDEDGNKRYLAGGAKSGHFCLIGGPLDGADTILICEGWATGASAHEASGLPVVAAMDAGNLAKVAESLRQRFPDAAITIVADNDEKPDRDINPGVAAATKAALAVRARVAVPPVPGDANDLAAAQGLDAVARLIAGAEFVPEPEPTYPAPELSVAEARARLQERIAEFMHEVTDYWTAVADAEVAIEASPIISAPAPARLDFNPVATIVPPRRGLPVEVGLGKTRGAREAIARLLGSGVMGRRKVVCAVPRHDLGAEQVEAFAALGVQAMLWKGRTAPDPAPDDSERLMCRDPEATFDALEVEQPVEQSSCKVTREGVVHTCPHYWTCGYQAQKPPARRAQVIVCAHDSLFHAKPDAVGTIGLLIIDEAFWQAGLRGLDRKMVVTEDSLEPDAAALTCFTPRGRVNYEATNDLLVLRGRLWKVLQSGLRGPLPLALLQAVGLTSKDCRFAAGLERARLRNPGLLPGMDAATRARKIAMVLPPHGAPWAPPGRAAAMWRILADALDNEHDAAGVAVINETTENGSVRALKLRWRSFLRSGWIDDIPVLHLDATMRRELVAPYLPELSTNEPVRTTTPHVRVRQVLGTPTSAKALTPEPQAPEREHKTSRRHRRDLVTYIRTRAKEVRRSEGKDLLVIGQKAAIDALRSETLPSRVDSVHFNALSGIDRWREIAGMIVMGRTLPPPIVVETLAIALSGRVPQREASAADWWYAVTERRIRLAAKRSHPVRSEAHDDPVVEAIRWSICEGELIQAIGRGRGVNRTADNPLQIDLLTDIVLPVTVEDLLDWPDLVPSRRDIMASRGVVLDNAADMARCFPDLWSSHEAARKDARRSGTNGYYRTLYNSEMSHSSAVVIYRPEGPGQKPRRAVFDLTLIRDPEAWLVERLGLLASCAVERSSRTTADDVAVSLAEEPGSDARDPPAGADVDGRAIREQRQRSEPPAHLESGMTADVGGHEPCAGVEERAGANEMGAGAEEAHSAVAVARAASRCETPGKPGVIADSSQCHVDQLAALTDRPTAAMSTDLATRRQRLAALSARLERLAPQPDNPRRSDGASHRTPAAGGER